MFEELQKYQNHLISQILNVPFNEAINIYIENFEFLRDYYFIFPHSEGTNYMQKFRDLALDQIDIIHFFSSETLYCLNAQSFISEMMHGNYQIKIASHLSLDTQIQSYLYRNYVNEKNKIPNNIADIQKLIESRLCLIDCLAYTFENALFNTEFTKTQIYKDNAYAFERYFFKSKVKAKLYSSKLLKLDRKLFNNEFANYYRRQYLLYYLELLVMVDISINKKSKTIYEKELTMVKYFHEEIGIVSDRELNLAKLFFTHGTRLKFFGKIQKGRNDIIKNLKNMAWDIFHLQYTLGNFIHIPESADFIIPFFVTYDQRLKDISPIYKLKSIAFIRNGFEKHFNFITDLIDPSIKHDYLTAKAYYERQRKLKDATEESIIVKIESEIEKYEKLLS